MSTQDTLPAGTLINGEYQIVRVLGSGGFANTYLARELSLQRHVAIKEYFPREVATRTNGSAVSAKSNQFMKDYLWGLQRFTKEARIIARFRHPNIVRVFRVLDANNTAYIVLDYVDGADMDVWLKRRRERERPQQTEFDALLPGLLQALEWIHADGVLHRDVKPANIYIRALDGMPVLLDFGASKFDFGEKTGTTAAIVSRGYSPQETYATDARMQGAWTDIYGLAATLYYALAGRAPPEATERVLNDTIVPATSLPLQGFRPSFLQAIDWGLRVQPLHRPQSIAQWAPSLLRGVNPPAQPRSANTQARAAAPPVSTPVAQQRPPPSHVPAASIVQQRPSTAHATQGTQQHPQAASLQMPPRPPSGQSPQTTAQSRGPQPTHLHSGQPSSRRPPSAQPYPPAATVLASVPMAIDPSGRSRGAPYPSSTGMPQPYRRRSRWPRALVAMTAVAALIGGAGWRWGSDLFSPRGPLSAIWSPSQTPDRSRSRDYRDRDYGAPSYRPPPETYTPPPQRARAPPPAYDPPPRQRTIREAEPSRPSAPPPARAVDNSPRVRSAPPSGSGSAPAIAIPQ